MGDQEVKSKVKLNFQVPPELADKDVFFKASKPKAKPEESKFRSFHIGGDTLSIDGKSVHISKLIELLREHGLSKTLPITVLLGKNIRYTNIDWNPLSYIVP